MSCNKICTVPCAVCATYSTSNKLGIPGNITGIPNFSFGTFTFYTLCDIHYTVYTIQYVYTVYSVHSIHYTLYSTYYTLYII